MKKTLLLGCVALGSMAFAAGNTYKVELFQDSTIEGKSFKAGEYKISLENGKAVIKQGKQSVEVPARQESVPNKVFSTVLKYSDGTNLQEINVGGTTTKIVFDGGAAMHSGS